MKFTIRGKKLEVTTALKNYIEEKIGRLDKYFENPDNISANVLMRLSGKDQVVEVTINTHGLILRGEESNKDLYASIDLVTDKIERQIRKNKTKIHKKTSKETIRDFSQEQQLLSIGLVNDTIADDEIKGLDSVSAKNKLNQLPENILSIISNIKSNILNKSKKFLEKIELVQKVDSNQ